MAHLSLILCDIGATSITGDKFLVDTVDVTVGGKRTQQVAVGDQATKKTVVAGQNVEIGAASASVSIGSSSSEVSIGSPTGVINFRGGRNHQVVDVRVTLD